MQAERRAEVEADVRPSLGELSEEAVQVFSDVRAGGEKIGQQQDSRRAACDAALGTLRDGWLGEFEICNLDNVAGEAGAELLGELEQVGIGSRKTAAVSDQ